MGIKRPGGSIAPARPAAPAPRPAAPAAAQSTAMQKHQPSAPAHAPQQAAPMQHAPQQAAPMHHAPHQPMMQQHAPPMMQAPQQSGGLMSNIAGGIMQGMTFGVGSAVANRAVDAVMGPRTTVVEHVNNGQAAAPAAAPAAAAPMMQQQPMMHQQPEMNNKCASELDFFNRCMQLNNNSFDACSQYSTQLQQCQRQ